MNIEDYFRIKGKYELIDGVYNVDGHVILNKKVDKLPCKFGKVTGSLWCHENNLTSLEGCPSWVGGEFWCNYNNNLETLEGCPRYVGGNFFCNHNNLTSLEGCPRYVGGGFWCDENLYNTKEYKQFKIIQKLRS